MVRRLSGSGRTIEILLAGFSLAFAPLNAAAQSGMSKAEGAQLYSAAGFSILNDLPVNRCGKPARPRVTLVDINGDKRPEALFVDTDAACYTKSGRYFAVLVKEGTTWRSVISGTGAIQALSGNTNGWLNMRVTDSGCVRDHHYDGRTYKAVSSCTGETVAPAPETAQPVPSASPGKTRAPRWRPRTRPRHSRRRAFPGAATHGGAPVKIRARRAIRQGLSKRWPT